MDKREASRKLYRSRRNDRTESSFDGEQEDYELTSTEKQTIELIEAKLNYRKISHGASRVVFLKPEKEIIKIARYGNKNKIHDGIQQNSREAQLWKKLEQEYGEDIPYPILEIKDNNPEYYWVEQPPVIPLHNVGTFKQAKQVKERIHKQMRPLSTYVSMFDITLSNIGINQDGEAVLYDYGIKPEPIE